MDQAQSRSAGHAPSLPSSEVTPPPVAQVGRLLALALDRELRFGLFLRLAVVLGARRGELCGLRWRAIDPERGEV
jgi:integrase